MEICQFVFDRSRKRVGKVDHHSGVLRLKTLGAEFAIAETDSQLHIVGNYSAQSLHALHNGLSANGRNAFDRLPIPNDHFVTDVPLDTEVLVMNMSAERGNLPDHGFLVCRLNSGHRTRNDNRAHHCKRRRETYLKADVPGKSAVFASDYKVEIGSARLTSVTEFAEMNL